MPPCLPLRPTSSQMALLLTDIGLIFEFQAQSELSLCLQVFTQADAAKHLEKSVNKKQRKSASKGRYTRQINTAYARLANSRKQFAKVKFQVGTNWIMSATVPGFTYPLSKSSCWYSQRQCKPPQPAPNKNTKAEIIACSQQWALDTEAMREELKKECATLAGCFITGLSQIIIMRTISDDIRTT